MWFHAHNLFILISCIVECIIFFPLIYSLRNGNKSTLPLIILRNLKCLFRMLISGRKPSTNEYITSTKYPCQLSHYAVVKNKKSPSLSVVTLCSSKKLSHYAVVKNKKSPSVGIEPTTTWLKATRSTTELRRLDV
jgi:hypothetical protein